MRPRPNLEPISTPLVAASQSFDPDGTVFLAAALLALVLAGGSFLALTARLPKAQGL